MSGDLITQKEVGSAASRLMCGKLAEINCKQIHNAVLNGAKWENEMDPLVHSQENAKLTVPIAVVAHLVERKILQLLQV